jgi:hypothetical protein
LLQGRKSANSYASSGVIRGMPAQVVTTLLNTRFLYDTGKLTHGHGHAISLALFVFWLAIVLLGSLNHALWRDEVGALSLALQGTNIFAMVTSLNDGHPALWFILLRIAHSLFPRPEVLQVVSLMVASAAILLLVIRSPFSLPVIALLLAGRFSIFEYSVIARNYGISMLLLFLLAIFYDRHRDRGVLLGVLLFLLANCNAHSVLLVGSFLLFWLVDILSGAKDVARSDLVNTFLVNAALATLGISVCLLTIYPAVTDWPDGVPYRSLIKAIFLPAASMALIPDFISQANSYAILSTTPRFNWVLMSLFLFGSTVGLIRRPAALMAAVVALIGLSMFFLIVYPAFYRHSALWLAFLISMYWIVGSRNSNAPAYSARAMSVISPVSTIGSILFLLLVALQVPGGLTSIANAVGYGPPFSRSRDFGNLVTSRPELRDSVIIS